MTSLRLSIRRTTPTAQQFYKLFYNLQAPSPPSTIRHKSTKPKPPKQPTEHPLKEATRSLLREIPHPIAIVTAWTSSPHLTARSSSSPSTTTNSTETEGPQPPQATGLTLSSLTSTTLNPPTISFNIRSSITTPSSTLDAIFSTGYFLVHFMLHNGAGAGAATAFTRPDPFAQEIVQTARTAGLKAAGYESRFGPRLAGSGVGAVLGVRWSGEATEVGDHVVLWGEVEEVLAAGSGGPAAEALCYVGGRYGGVGSLEGESAGGEIVD